MEDPLPRWNKHVRAFATKHKIRLRLAEDGELRLLLGPRSTENHASIHGDSKGKWLWAVYYTAPQADRVTQSVKDIATKLVPLDGEGFYLVPEKDLLKACALNRWTKPRYKSVVARKARESAQLDRFVQALDA